MPAGAWIPAFCPHPSWLYRNLDITYVVHPVARQVAVEAEPGMRVAVGALPVRGAFALAAHRDQAAARKSLGIDPGRFVATLCTGSLALGRLAGAVTAAVRRIAAAPKPAAPAPASTTRPAAPASAASRPPPLRPPPPPPRPGLPRPGLPPPRPPSAADGLRTTWPS